MLDRLAIIRALALGIEADAADIAQGWAFGSTSPLNAGLGWFVIGGEFFDSESVRLVGLTVQDVGSFLGKGWVVPDAFIKPNHRLRFITSWVLFVGLVDDDAIFSDDIHFRHMNLLWGIIYQNPSGRSMVILREMVR
jgi:hypothetical protein